MNRVFEDDGLVVDSGPSPDWSVIWLHGLGADAGDFEAVVPALGLKQATRFIFPNAPWIAVTMNGGMECRAWYNILRADRLSRVIDEAGLDQTRERIRGLIAAEQARGVPATQIFLAGFSQGGAVAYYTALTHAERLAGVVALSTYLPAPLMRAEAVFAAPGDLPIFCAHGSEDTVVATDFGQEGFLRLQHLGYAPEWHEYPMEHAVSISEIRELGRWLNARMSAS